jgi:multidrug efflux pump
MSSAADTTKSGRTAFADGPRLLALCRGTLATARRLEAGKPVIWRLPEHGYQPVKMGPEYLDRTRWFLLDGWGPGAHYGLQPVMLQADRDARKSVADLDALQVRAGNGSLVPLSNLVTLREIAEPGTFNRFNRLRSITLSARLAPGYPLGDAVAWAQQSVRDNLPDYAQVSWKGEARELQQSGGEVMVTFALALLIVYLALAAQFESFLHPLVIMLTVPLGVLGALLGLWVTGGTMNLFSQIGIVMLVGLAAKNGILIVEFANQLRDQGRNIHEAIVESSTVRLRPILMTSIATIMGALPLVIFGGPGSASRATIGIVVVFGVAFSTLLSLFVVPAFYALLAPYTHSPEAVAHELQRLEDETPPVGGHG